jgi:hypothetical protein
MHFQAAWKLVTSTAAALLLAQVPVFATATFSGWQIDNGNANTPWSLTNITTGSGSADMDLVVAAGPAQSSGTVFLVFGTMTLGDQTSTPLFTTILNLDSIHITSNGSSPNKALVVQNGVVLEANPSHSKSATNNFSISHQPSGFSNSLQANPNQGANVFLIKVQFTFAANANWTASTPVHLRFGVTPG